MKTAIKVISSNLAGLETKVIKLKAELEASGLSSTTIAIKTATIAIYEEAVAEHHSALYELELLSDGVPF